MKGFPSASTVTCAPRPASSRLSATYGVKRTPLPALTSPSGIVLQAAAVSRAPGAGEDDEQSLGHVGAES